MRKNILQPARIRTRNIVLLDMAYVLLKVLVLSSTVIGLINVNMQII